MTLRKCTAGRQEDVVENFPLRTTRYTRALALQRAIRSIGQDVGKNT
jgi:hypothetical protein